MRLRATPWHLHFTVAFRAFCGRGVVLATRTPQTRELHAVLHPKGVIACWHPEEPFPYEYSKPINLKELEKEKQSFGALNEETKRIAELKGSLAHTGPPDHMLREIFYTGKHEWKPRYREDRLRSVAAPEPKRRK